MTTDTLLQHPLARVAAAPPEVVSATLGRRMTALLGEGALALAPLLVPLSALAGVAAGWAWIVGCLGVLGVATTLVADLGRTGQTPVRRLLGLRTVAADAFPPSLADAFGRRVTTADLRAGRDPLLLVPDPGQRPLPVVRAGWQSPRAAVAGTWRLELDDGRQFAITRATLVGRDPGGDRADEDAPGHELIAIVDLTRSVSRVHALVEPGEDCLWLTDTGTTNGTRAASPSASGGTVIERWLQPGERAAVRTGGTIHLGDRVLRVTRSSGTVNGNASRRHPRDADLACAHTSSRRAAQGSDPADPHTSSRRTPGSPLGD